MSRGVVEHHRRDETTEVTGVGGLRTNAISAMMDTDFDHGRPSIGTVT
ncbi:hypothetical protein ABH917_003435 [Thermobifida halotolerans]